jgi:hypothetical protein
MLLKLVVASILGLGLVLPGTIVQKQAAPASALHAAKATCCCEGGCGCGSDDCVCATCPICSIGACCGTSAAKNATSKKSSGQSTHKCHSGMKCCQVDHVKK